MLIEMMLEDQALRQTTIRGSDPTDKLFDTIKKNDESNTKKIKALFTEHGCPNIDMVGYDGVYAFWTLAQNITDYDFKHMLLPNIEEAFARDTLNGELYAKYIDSLLLYDGKPQKYGTQLKPLDEWVDNTPIPLEIEDPTHVNTLRKEIGLSKLEDFLKMVKSTVFPELATTSSTMADKQDHAGTGIGLELEVIWIGSIENMTVKTFIVTKIIKDSSVDKAGIKVGDNIIAIDGITVEDSSMNKLIRLMDKQAGDDLTLVIKQLDSNLKQVTVKVTATNA
jgi:hypothetical protein